MTICVADYTRVETGALVAKQGPRFLWLYELRSGGYAKRAAASASAAMVFRILRNSGFWPSKRPSAVKLAIVARAPANLSRSGRMIATWGSLGLMNSQGTGKIRLG